MANYYFYGGHTYQIVTTPKTWSSASSYASSIGGHLAKITTSSENLFVLQAAYNETDPSLMPTAPDGGGAYYLWLGASDTAIEGTWKWMDGASLSTYSKWGSGAGVNEPDNFMNQDGLALSLTGWPFNSGNPYVGAIGDAGEWNDISTNNQIYSIVEWDTRKDGTTSSDSLFGSAAADTLKGLAGNDYLFGAGGSDVLIGGLGQDFLHGGSDTVRDIFDFNSVAESKVGSTLQDKIYNFVTGKDDIDLSGIDANTKVSADQAFKFGGTTKIANGVWYEKSGADLLVHADINGDKVSDMDIQLVGLSKIVATDFVL